MAYGLQIYTTEGLTVIDTVNSAQIISTANGSGSSGTISAPSGYNETVGSIHVITNDGKAVPVFTYSSGSNSYSWDNTQYIFGSAYVSQNFTIYFFRVF